MQANGAIQPLRAQSRSDRTPDSAELHEIAQTRDRSNAGSHTHLQVGGASLDHGAGVGNAGALDLQVGQALQLVVGEGVGSLRSSSDAHIREESVAAPDPHAGDMGHHRGGPPQDRRERPVVLHIRQAAPC